MGQKCHMKIKNKDEQRPYILDPYLQAEIKSNKKEKNYINQRTYTKLLKIDRK